MALMLTIAGAARSDVVSPQVNEGTIKITGTLQSRRCGSDWLIQKNL
jgi:hypothetical protein